MRQPPALAAFSSGSSCRSCPGFLEVWWSGLSPAGAGGDSIETDVVPGCDYHRESANFTRLLKERGRFHRPDGLSEADSALRGGVGVDLTACGLVAVALKSG